MHWYTSSGGQQPDVDTLKSAGTIDVWRVATQSFRSDGKVLAGLSLDERGRIDGMSGPVAARRFAIVRGTLRQILGQYLDIAPSAVAFAYGEHGKPRLADAFASTALEFSVSYSGELALYGVTCGCQIGVDVEHLIARPGMLEIAHQFLSPQEAAAIAASPPEQQAVAFLSYWTAKEAYLKGRGLGLAAPPAQSELRAELPSETGWSVRSVDVGPDYVAAVAVEGPIRVVRTWTC